jgi:putative membrane protein
MKIIKRFVAFAMSLMLLAIIPTVTGMAQENSKLSDAEVASVAVVANQIDINYGEIAKERSKDQDILKFAEAMISDHKAVISQATGSK